MDSILITPQNQSESALLLDLLKRMRISAQVLTEEDKEELGLLKMMNEADRTQKVSKSQIMDKLRGR